MDGKRARMFQNGLGQLEATEAKSISYPADMVPSCSYICMTPR